MTIKRGKCQADEEEKGRRKEGKLLAGIVGGGVGNRKQDKSGEGLPT